MKLDQLKVAICQINSTVGDLSGNSRKIIEYYLKSVEDYSPDMVVFPECALSGYPPEDLLLKSGFMNALAKSLDSVRKEVGRTLAVVGTPMMKEGRRFNSAVGIQNGKILWAYSKRILPNYGVFDEKRYFTPGSDLGLFRVQGVPAGISICEDIWEDDMRLSPCMAQAKRGAKILINISASPFHSGKFGVRYDLLKRRVAAVKTPVIYANCVGGQDELVYDGRSMAMDAKGQLRVLASSFEEDIRIVHIDLANGQVKSIWREKAALPLGVPEIHQALVLGTRDYVNKNRFKSALVGLSGGVDSALVAALAAEAIGRDRVIGVTLPSKFSSEETRGDAEKLARNLGIQFLKIPIQKINRAFLDELAPFLKGRKPDVTEENLQPRIRATILMALSNRYGHLVLTTGNKSEIAAGYCTLYGDTAGGFAMLKDASKGMVYSLARYVNKMAGRPVIPASTLSRAPTAELKFRQKDQDTLPPYPVLDKILDGYVEEDLGYDDLIRKGFDKETVKKVIRMVDSSEYKRRQSPPGIKISPKAFGRDRRMPVTNLFSDSP
ncbi:MAG: hypothetical protein A2901_03015 [Elusimicrobia bacterium RIFCSPLOWO2_01_FULL_54_10]|nr:MAG: hypothetical protein A2901_03015 [Elusimicrobia bacterium RIFCSPLOWO2_01_FULL_54_10]